MLIVASLGDILLALLCIASTTTVIVFFIFGVPRPTQLLLVLYFQEPLKRASTERADTIYTISSTRIGVLVVTKELFFLIGIFSYLC